MLDLYQRRAVGSWRHYSLTSPSHISCTLRVSQISGRFGINSDLRQICQKRSSVVVSANSMSVDVIKSPADKKEYRWVVLESKLTCLLISDPEMNALPSAASASNGQVRFACVDTLVSRCAERR